MFICPPEMLYTAARQCRTLNRLAILVWGLMKDCFPTQGIDNAEVFVALGESRSGKKSRMEIVLFMGEFFNLSSFIGRNVNRKDRKQEFR